MSLADLSQKHPAQVAGPRVRHRARVPVAAAVASGVATIVRAAKKATAGSSDDEILRRMRARPNLLKQGRPPQSELAGMERLGGDAPERA